MKQQALYFFMCLILSLTGCAKANFGAVQASSTGAESSTSTAAGGTSSNSVTGNVNGNGGTTSNTPLNTSVSLPKVQFSSPACAHGSDCEVDLTLDAAYPYAVGFDWKTNDTAYLTPHTPAYGQPNVHYVPTSGHVNFAPGQSVVKVYVQNINPDNYEIIIAIIMSNCTYNAASESCTNMIQL